MKNLEDLFTAEMKNLYALEKQIEGSMTQLNSANNSKLQKRLDKFNKDNAKHYETIQQLLQKLSINPGNTTDSVAAEILANLVEQSNSDLSAEIRDASVLASLNRLAAYKAINYINARRMAKVIKVKKVSKKLKRCRRDCEDHLSKFKKIARKRVYKQAV